MKKLCIKFLLILSLLANNAFAEIDIWGNIYLHLPLPQTQEDIDSLTSKIKADVNYSRSVGIGTYEDIIGFIIPAKFNTTLNESYYAKIANNTLKALTYAQYILFNISNLNADEINLATPILFNLQNAFLKVNPNLKFGLRLNYSKENNVDKSILNILEESSQKYSEIDFSGGLADFVEDAYKNKEIWENLSDIDFLVTTPTYIDISNINSFIKLLSHSTKLKGLDVTKSFLKDCLCPDPERAKNDVISLFTDELKKHPSITFLKIGSNNFNNQHAGLFADAIDHFENMTLIDISNNQIGGKDGNRILQAISKHKYLSHVNISSNNFHAENAHSYAGVISQKPNLSFLNASYNFFGVEGSEIIRNAMNTPLLLQSLQISHFRKNYDIYKSSKEKSEITFQWSSLYFVDFGQNYFVTEEDYNIHFNFVKTFQYYYLDANNIFLTDFSKFSQALIETDLKYLDLNSNNLSSKNSDDVARILYFTPQMIGINLENNAFIGKDMYKISKALTTFPILEFLALSNNIFDSQGIMVLANYLKQDRGLKRLYLSNVELQNSVGAELFKALDAQKNLEVLDISFNDVEKSGVKTLLNSLKNKKNFNTLRLIGNKFDCDDLKKLDFSIQFRCE